MRVSEAMTTDVQVLNPNQSVIDAARLMAERDIGSLPVGRDGRLVGMVTDRDIVVRAVAKGKSTDTEVGEIMTDDVKYCFEDEDTSEVARNMADIQVKRLVVLNRDKQLVGVVALADIAVSDGAQAAGTAESGIAQGVQGHKS